MKFTISILTYTALDHAKKCIQSVLENSRNFSLILCANGNAEAAKYFKQVERENRGVSIAVRVLPKNEGFIDPNRMALRNTNSPYFVMLNDDAIVPPGWLEMMEAEMLKDSKTAIVGASGSCCSLKPNLDGYPGAMFEYVEGSCLMGRTEVLERHGLFSPYLCVHPDTLVLKSDLSWVKASTLKKNDELVSVDEYPAESVKGAGRRFRRATVDRIGIRKADCVKITLETGVEVICSKDHRWLSKKQINNGQKYDWVESFNLKAGHRLCVPFNTWERDDSFESGWLSGIFDGEGFIRSGGRSSDFNKVGTSVGLGIVQKDGEVLRRAVRILHKMGIPHIKREHSRDIFNLEIFVRKWAMEILGRTNPVRLMPKSHLLWLNRALRSRNTYDAKTITKIEPVGVCDVVTMETSTRTFIANGIVSHNCFAYGEDSDLSLRMRRLGYRIARAPFKIEHHRQSTSKHIPGINEVRIANQQEVHRRFGHYLKVRKFGYPITVVRRGAFGDVLLTTGVIEALAKQNPLSKIYVESDCYSIYRDHPHVEKAANRIRTGDRTEQRINLDMVYENCPGVNIVDAYAKAANLDGEFIPIPKIYVNDCERAWAEKCIGDGQKWCAIHAGPSWPGKTWDDRRWELVVKHLNQRGWRVVLVGGKNNLDSGDLDARGHTTLHQLAALIGKCQMFIGIDSLPMHLASIQGVPTIGLFGVSSPEIVFSVKRFVYPICSSPVHLETGIRHKTTGKTMIHVQDNPMLTISAGEVMDKIDEIL